MALTTTAQDVLAGTDALASALLAPAGPEETLLAGRLGIDHPAGWWPSAPQLKAYDAAGFDLVQVRMPPRSLLTEERAASEHAAALRAGLSLTGLRLVLHAPDDLLAGTPEHDRQLAGALSYAAAAGAELIVYHGARIPVAGAGVRARLADEERSLRTLLRRAGSLGVRVAIENLAPVYPSPAHPEEVCHDPGALAALVRRLDSEHVGVCLDVGHAYIVAELAGCELAELVEPALERVIIFHVHDNLGARTRAPGRGGIDPVRLDLHLPPGAGTVPWRALAAPMLSSGAPIQLEVHPAGRPEPTRLAVLAREVIRRAAGL